MRMTSSADGQGGVVSTEFIILFPVFFAIVLGTVWAGASFFRYMNLEQSAREGARYGATIPTGYPSDGDVSGSPGAAWFTAVADAVEHASMGESAICVAYVGPLGNQDADDGVPIARRYVRPAGISTGAVEAGVCFDDGRTPAANIREPRRVQVQVQGETFLAGFGFVDGLMTGSATARFEAVYPS